MKKKNMKVIKSRKNPYLISNEGLKNIRGGYSETLIFRNFFLSH